MIKVAKFGGSSVADASQFQKVREIVKADPDRKFVVVSASGKRCKGDNKITDLLLLVNAHIQYGVDCTALLATIEQRFMDIALELGLDFPLAEEFMSLVNDIDKFTPEYVVSRGEWFTAKLMAEYLGMPFVDAADVIVFHHDGTVDMERTQTKLREAVIHSGGTFVLPGFYNWTDVSGFLAADPRVVENPRGIHRITFEEMRELSYMGASVLQEEAIFPVREVNIPIQIKNTNAPDEFGTIIRETANEHAREHLITGSAGKKDFVGIYVQKAHMSNEIGCIRNALSILERYGVSVEHIPTGVDSFSIVVNGEDVKDTIYSIVADMQRDLQPDSINVLPGLALISVVGRNMSRRAGTSGQIFGALGEAGINIRMITQSSQEISIIVGVQNEDFEKAIRVIYNRFGDAVVIRDR